MVVAVEAAEREVVGSTDEPARRGRVVDVAAEDVREVAGHDGVADRGRERVGEDQLARLLQRTVVVDEHRRRDADGGIVERGDQRLEPAGTDDDVGVEEAEELATRVLDAVLVAAGEAEVVVDREQPDVGAVGEQQRRARGRVVGQAVDHDHLVGDRRVPGDGVEHLEHDGPGPIGDHDDRDRWIVAGGDVGVDRHARIHERVTIRSGRHPSRR